MSKDSTIQIEHFQRWLWNGAKGETSSIGNAGGTTLIDSARTEVNDFWNEFTIMIISGNNIGEVRQIVDFDAASDTITVGRAFTNQVASGVGYIIRRDFNYSMGANNADNDFDSSAVAGDIDGSILERTESLLKALQVVAAAGTGFEEDGSGATLYNTVIAVEGVTDGAGTTATIVDSSRTEGADYWNGNSIVMLAGSAVGEVRTIVDDDGAGTLTVEPVLGAASGNTNAYLILNQKSADWIVGDNNANNAYDSSAVVVNSDGSILERLEHILVALGGTTGTTTALGLSTTAIDTSRTEAADYWNGGIFVCVDGANAGLGRPIYDFDAALDTLHFEPAFPNAVASGVEYIILNRYDAARLLGANNADNAIDTSTVAENADGSVLERLEYIQNHVIPDISGLAWYGTVTTADTTSSWTSTGLIGKGTNIFNDNYYIQFIEADNAAPEGEVQKVSAYNTATGVFSVASAYTVAPDVGDQFIVYHESLAMNGRDDADNVYASTNVTVNNDGSMIERVEGILSQHRSKGYKGDIYYVASTGNDSNDGLTIATAFLTIDYAVGQCTSRNDDLIIVVGGVSTYDENVNTGGVVVDVYGVHIIAAGAVSVHNSNVGATAVFTISVKAEIAGFTIIETTNTVHGFNFGNGSSDSHLHDIYFTGSMENGVFIGSAANIIIEDNYFRTITNDGIELDSGDYCRIRNNVFTGIGDNAIHINDISSDWNNIYNNIINGAGTTTNGINAAVGNHNIIANNFVEGCTNNIVNNATNTHLLDNHEEFSQINGNTVLSDDDVIQAFATLWAANGANTFNPTIDGVARTDLETALEALSGMITEIGGMALSGTVSAATDVSNFKIAELTGYGDDFFNTDWVCVCVHNADNDGNAPEGEYVDITDYTSSDGSLVTVAFTVAPTVGDEMMIIRRTLLLTDAVALKTTPATNSLAYRISQYLADGDGDFATGTVLPANKSLRDIIGTAYLDAGGADPEVENIQEHLIAGVHAGGTATNLPANTSLYDITGGFSGDGGVAQDDSIKASLDLAHTDLDAILASVEPDLGGVALYGIVTTANDATNFKVDGLKGKGTNVFNDRYYCHVVEADNAAPEGETRKISAYTTADGDFTVAAFSVAPDVGDQILILHESLAVMFMHADPTLTSVIDDSIIAHILAVDGTTADYNDNTMSLEALNIDLDAIIVGTITNATGADVATDVVALQADVGNPSARTNSQTIEAMLGNADTANVTLAGIIGAEYVNNNGNPDVDNIRAHLRAGLVNGTGTVLPANKSLYDIIGTTYVDGGGAFNVDSVWDDLRTLGQYVIDGTAGAEAGTVLPAGKSLYDALIGGVDAVDRVMGRTQIKEFSVTAAANAGVTVVATVTTQPCLIKSVVIHADTAQTGDMTSCALKGGTNQVVTFIDAATAIQANLDAADKQVSWTGARRFVATDTIAINLQGTGVTAVDLTVTIEYMACVDGGYLV